MTAQTPAETLLPCPFCKSDELSHGWAAPGFRGGLSDGHVECMECGALIIAATEQDAIASWNRRAPSLTAAARRCQELEGEVARLTAEVERLRGPITEYKRGYGPGDGDSAALTGAA